LEIRVRIRALICAVAAAAAAFPIHPRAMGKPGVTPVPCPQQTWEPRDPTFEALPGAKAFFGNYEGGVYRVEIPETWNGDLVLYAHGYVASGGDNGSQLRVGNAPIRQHLIEQGYAWAASSYRCNGYVPGQGLADTVALSGLFTRLNQGRAPRRTYLTGTSMGGHVTVLGMHEFPTAFAGGLAMCPAGPELFDFFAASTAAAEVVTGVQLTRDTLRDGLQKMSELLGKPPAYTEKGKQLASIEIQISGGPRPFAVEGLASRFIPNISASATALLGGTTPVDRAAATTQIKYAIDDNLGLTADAISAQVRRKVADPEVRNTNGPYEEVVPYDGKIERPLLTMHGTGDLFVPIFLERTLKKEIANAGRQNLLTQRIYRIAGHCQFSQPEMIKSFDDMVKWASGGAKPEGDDVDADLANAGMMFTQPLRDHDPGGIRIVPQSK
jgi:pimeloyl-ACP methyl ester carboxylesterase